MQMSEDEIVRKYKEAKKKREYIQILADLNCVSKSTIVDILKKHNIPLPGNPNLVRKRNVLKIVQQVMISIYQVIIY